MLESSHSQAAKLVARQRGHQGVWCIYRRSDRNRKFLVCLEGSPKYKDGGRTFKVFYKAQEYFQEMVNAP